MGYTAKVVDKFQFYFLGISVPFIISAMGKFRHLSFHYPNYSVSPLSTPLMSWSGVCCHWLQIAENSQSVLFRHRWSPSCFCLNWRLPPLPSADLSVLISQASSCALACSMLMITTAEEQGAQDIRALRVKNSFHKHWLVLWVEPFKDYLCATKLVRVWTWVTELVCCE